ncbi:probable serine/threonine-protein kinase roco9 [Nylanderia fulva]|uniref:probable serine/threonine-protein kinase roco9 n=1 Tax=Nylanderia fulva TaxID=613905 RepID=UPI0010FB27A0|nr:probable serine/threonine-protein kinase roco9 [Nylanderia fulva]
MRIFLFNGFLLLVFVVAPVPDVFVNSSKSAEIMDQNPLPNTCRYITANSVLEARCFQLKSQTIAMLDLNPDIQVLNITGSLLFTLNNDSLHLYKELEFIYLRHNIISIIRKAAFANQLYLQVLDLTNSFCRILPKSLFQLPYLHTLYLGENWLTDRMFNVNVTSPLRILQLSDNKLRVIPNIGLQPTLLNLNVSNNFITSIRTEDLAPFCSLNDLDLTGNDIRFNARSCDCQTFNAWVKLRQIKMKPKLYKCPYSSALNKTCANVSFSNRTYELFNECLAMMQQMIEEDIQQKMEKDIQQKMEPEKPRSVWLIFASCVLVCLFIVFVTLFCVHNWNRRQCRKQQEQLTMIYNNTELNTELLQQQSDNN